MSASWYAKNARHSAGRRASDLRHPSLAVTADVASHLPAAGRVPDVDGVVQVEVLGKAGRSSA